MQTLKGKYNQARIMIPPQAHLDNATYEQIRRFLDHPAFEGEAISIMPDTHAGKGSVIGFTMPLGDKIVPNVVGVDIGCGVLSLCLGAIHPDLQELDDYILQHIPYGFKVRKEAHPLLSQYPDLMRDLHRVCEHTSQDAGRVQCSLGTLGGGNHFIELGRDSSGDTWLTIHSGSRHFGLSVAEYYQARAVEHLPATWKQSKDLAWLTESTGALDYLRDMRCAQVYAELNREIMATDICTFLGRDSQSLDRVHSVHNFIDFEDHIIRKGAIRASGDTMLVIPFNMRDGLILGRGRSGSTWNYSAPHGAGRLLSRRQARERLDLDRARQDMKQAGVFTRSLNKNSLDEAAGAYKDKAMIIDALKDVVEITDWVRPVYNFKDH